MARRKNYNGLTDRELEMIVLRVHMGLSLQAVASEMGSVRPEQKTISKQAIDCYLGRAFRKLRRKPEEKW